MLAQGTTSLTFARPAAQGPGTQGFQSISDPTIQPFFPDGLGAALGITASIDLRGNGRPDIVACHSNGPPHPPSIKVPCRILRPQPDGSVIDITRQLLGSGALPSVTNAREIVSGDFNRDGRPDIFIAAHGYDAPPFGGETNVLLISRADGTYADRSSTLPQAPDFSHSACAGDINSDGFLDIYVGNQGGAPIGPYFLMGRGDGTFTQKTTGLPPTLSAGVFDNSNLPGGNFEIFGSCALVDIDQDGSPDLVLGIFPNAYVDNIVLFNDGTGDFTRRPRLVLPRGPLPIDNFVTLDILPMDINRDGRPDLMLLSSAAKTDTGFGLQVLINRSDGTLVDETSTRVSPSTDHLTGPWYAFIHVADFNGDGWMDFYLDTISHEDNSIHPRVWLNNGNNTWTPVAPASLPSEFVAGVLHAVDFDGDGRADILQLGNAPVPFPDIGYRSFLNRTSSLPGAPSGLITSSSGSSVTLTWMAPTTGLPDTYVIEAGSASGSTNLANFSTGTIATRFSASGVVAGTYYVRVRAGNASGTSAPSNEATLTVGGGGCSAAPGTPVVTQTNVSATGGTVVLSWTAAPGNPTSYIVEAGSRSGGVDLANTDLGGPAASLTASGVPRGTYYVRIRGRNACGLGPASNEVVITVG